MIDAITYNIANLANFDGRDSRPTFWWYVLFVIVAQYGISFLATIPMMAGVVGSAFDAAQSGASEAQMQSELLDTMVGTMETVMWVGIITTVIGGLALVASFVRRLHDSGNSGWWVCIPLATQAAALVFSIQIMDRLEELFAVASDPAQMQQLQSQMLFEGGGFVGYIGYLVVIIFGVLKSQPGPNKYGDPPT